MFVRLLIGLVPISLWASCGGLLPTQFVVDQWGPRQGLPEERILSITQTPDGYLWLGTANGLVRFDGHNFRVFQDSETTTLLPLYLRTVFSTRQGELLVMGADQALSLMQPRPERPLAPGKGPMVMETVPFTEDQKGRVYVPTFRGIYSYWDGRLERALLEPPDVIGHVKAVTPDLQGAFLLGTDRGQVLLVGSDRKVQSRWMLEGEIRTLRRDRAGVVWASSAAGLYRMQRGKWEKVNEESTTSVLQDREGVLWIGTDRGLSCLASDGIHQVGPSAGLLADKVGEIFEDREGNIWISFVSTGLFRLKRPKFYSMGEPEGLPSDRVYGVRTTSDSTWVSHAGGVTRIQGSKLNTVDLPAVDKRARNLSIDAGGNVWTGSLTTLARIDPATMKAQAVNVPWAQPEMVNLYTARDGRVWGVDRGGLFRIEQNGAVKIAVNGLPKPLGFRTQLTETSDGRMWLASRYLGFFAIEGSEARQVEPNNPVWASIHAIYPGSDKELWVGFDGQGLGRWRDGKLRRFGATPDAPENHVFYIAEDKQGYLWLGLRRQLLRVRKEFLNDYMDGKRADVPREVFDMGDGLRSANFGLALLPAAAGPADIVWVPSLRGVLRIDTRNIVKNQLPPQVVIRQVWGDNSELPVESNQVRMPSTVNTLRIDFAATSLTESSRVQYRRRLEGFDEQWLGPDSAQAASYTNLAPGEYTFRLQACNNDGVWNETGLSLKIIRLPALYQTASFRVVMLVTLMAAIAGLVRWRTSVLQKQKIHLEERVLSRTAELEKAKVAAEGAANAKADFLATMSHEIRTPLHGVLGTLELLAETALDTEQREHIAVIRSSSDALLTVLNDVLDLSKLEAGCMGMAKKPFSLRKTIEDVAQPLESTVRLKKICVSVSYDSELPTHLLGDESRIRQIMFNLVSNAVKFTDEGSVDICASGGRCGGTEWDVRVEIHDTGIGIPQDRISSLFQKFYQVDGSFSRRYGGTGLGLAICQKLAQAMGGSIDVSSEEGRGSVFTLRLRLTETDAVEKSSAPTGGFTRQFTGRVLLAEDNAVNRRLAESLLSRLGCQVDGVVNGSDAVARVESNAYDLVLMDLHMPMMDGLEATRLIRTTLPLARQPVIIALTANALDGDRERCLDAGMNGYLAKPFHLDDLVALLALHLPNGTVV